jgi:phosphate transport system protein
VTRVIDPVMKGLRETLLLMGSRAEAILDKAIRSIVERNPALAEEVQRDDLEIDRLDVEVDDAVLRALALQAPVAADLREVVAIKMIATDLERVGDLSRNLGKSAVRLALHPETPLPPALLRLARSAQEMLRRALNAFSEVDAGEARQVLSADDDVDRMQDEVVRGELAGGRSHPGRQEPRARRGPRDEHRGRRGPDGRSAQHQARRQAPALSTSIRRKLGAARDCLETVRGVGYRFSYAPHP